MNIRKVLICLLFISCFGDNVKELDDQNFSYIEITDYPLENAKNAKLIFYKKGSNFKQKISEYKDFSFNTYTSENTNSKILNVALNFDNSSPINNDWHFEVKDNIVEKIKIVKSPKMGTAGEFEIEETTFKNYDPAKDGAISWKVAGPETGTGSEAKFSKSFNLPGEYTISCSLGGRSCKEPLKINIIEPMVTVDQCKWIDKDSGSGNIIKQAGLNQEISAFVSGNGLDNEDITLNIYDDDSTGNNIVFTNTFKTNEKHKTGFYFPLTITQEIVDKIKEHGFADRGDLYFNLVRNGAETPIKNGDKKLGEFLRVTLDPQIINAYFCDANDTEQVFSSPLNGALYFKIYAINMVDKKVEINFLTESDAYWTWDDELKIGKWEDIKDKFKDEKIRDTKTAAFDKKGEILIPVDLSKMGKPKNFIRLNAMVKILKDEETTEKQEEKGFYIKHTDLAIVFPGATLPTMVENKGAVKVGRENIQEGTRDDGVCLCKDYDLVWGEKVSCEFRKKVVEIAKNLGLPQEKNEGANWLMTVMALESAYTFDPKIGTFGKDPDENKKNKYVGLIQFGKGAATDIGTTRTHLMSLTAEKQLEFVEKHFKQKKFDKLLTSRTALYLAVNYPNSTVHASNKNYVVYDSSNAAYDSNDLFKKEKHESKIEKGKKVYPDDVVGSTYVWEMEEALEDIGKLGESHKAKNYECGINNSNETINAREVVTYHIYNGGKIEKHIPKTIKDGFEKKYKYVYHDKNGKEHELGIFNFKLTKEMNKGNVAGTHDVELIDIREFKGYSSNEVKLKFLTLNTESDRYYINPDCYAGLLGAMADMNVDYLGFNGFSNYQAKSTGGSSSHRNGEKGDLRYLSKNKKGEATVLWDAF